VGEITRESRPRDQEPPHLDRRFRAFDLPGLGDDDPNRKYLEVILQEVERLEGILHEILSFAHPASPEKMKRSINEIIEKSLLVLTGEVDKNGVELDSI